MKLHFGDEQFEVDAAQLPIAFTQVTLVERDKTGKRDIIKGRKFTLLLLEVFQVYRLKKTEEANQLLF